MLNFQSRKNIIYYQRKEKERKRKKYLCIEKQVKSLGKIKRMEKEIVMESERRTKTKRATTEVIRVEQAP